MKKKNKKKNNNKKKESTKRLIIYLTILIVLLISIIGFLYYLKEKRGVLILTNKKLLEISQDIENVLDKDLKSISFTRKYTQSTRYENKRKDSLEWNLCIKEITIPENIPIVKCQELIYASIGKTKGKILNFSKKENKEYFLLVFDIGILKYQTHKITLLKKRIPKIKKRIPKIAIIIDDVGNNLNSDLFKLNKNITLSILPFLPRSHECAQLGHEKRFELMLHLPMEFHGYSSSRKNLGKGAILVDISLEEVSKRTEYALKSLPYIKGVNNHMGSKATENEKIMNAVLKKIKDYNLYFIDSLTSNYSVASKVAHKCNVPCATRNIFIDNSREMESIKKQINELIRIAKLKGSAIGIGHVQSKNTLLALKSIDSLLKREDVQLVPASMLVK
ncbi:MAG: divergent polysaccharide deacetylase family protein [bacterium]|nr:divergent polysaccharide deacetylase family protein [bacterium]